MTLSPEAIASPAAVSRTTAWGLLLFAGSIWGATFVFGRIAAETGAAPLGLTVWQSVIGSGVLVAIHAGMRWRVPMSRVHVWFYIVCGILGTALPSTLYYYAASRVPSGVLAITIATVPMITLLLAVTLRIEQARLIRVVGVALGATGVAMLVLPQSSLPDPAGVPWVLVALTCAASYAVENIVIALRMPAGLRPLTALCGMTVAATLLLIPIALLTGAHVVPQWPPGPLEGAVLAMALINVVAYSIFVWLINRAGPVFAAQLSYVVTISGVLWGIAVFSESHSGWVWTAFVVMMFGLACVSPHKSPPDPPVS